MRAQKSEILAESGRHWPKASRLTIIAGVATVSLLGVVAATAVVPGYEDSSINTTPIREQLPTPIIAPVEAAELPFVFDEVIRPGDTIRSLSRRLGINDREAIAFLSSGDKGREVLRTLRAGRSVTAMILPDGKVLSLNLPVGGSNERYIVEREDGKLVARGRDAEALETVVELRSGVIRHSLFGATAAAGIPDSIASQFAQIFGTQLDFSRDIRQGDRFSVIYETHNDNGVPVQTGRILAAEFVNQGTTHTVILHEKDNGEEAYYTPDGRGLNQAFLRYPLEFTRISSQFGRRQHPIHGNWRNHNGTDFAAPTGTPIMASSDGRVSFVGAQRGYGNTVILDHRNGYQSLYAHLNGFKRGLSNGQRVRQGDIIGYVGATGWATGPHLHYEIRIEGKPHDPLRVALPEVEPLDDAALAKFKKTAEPVLEQLALLNYSRTTVAAASASN